MTRESLKSRLFIKPALVGLLQTHPNPVLAEMAGMCGYDFVILDCEHGLFSEMDVVQALVALRSSGVASVVRLRGQDPQSVGRYLDFGVENILVPNVATADQGETLARAMQYPPAGTRGMGASAHYATRYGMDLATHRRAPRGDACLLVIIESVRGVENVDEILGVDGVDGAIIGPADLSADLGSVGDFSSSTYAQAVTRVERAAANRNKLLGAAPHSGYPIETLVSHGHRILIVGTDTPLIREAMTTQVLRAKSCIGQIPITPGNVEVDKKLDQTD